jgi:hypothetical protein
MKARRRTARRMRMMNSQRSVRAGVVVLSLATLDFQSGWNAQGTAVAGGAAVFTVSGTGGEGFSRSILKTGHIYEVTCSYTKGVAGSNFLIANAAASGTPLAAGPGSGTSGTITGRFAATNPSLYFRLAAAADTLTITALSVVEVN